MPLLSSISDQICKSSSVLPFLFSSDIPLMNTMLDLLRGAGKKGLSRTKLAVLVAEILSAAAVVWFGIPFLLGFLSSASPRIWTHLRSSTAPRYLFLAVNFIIFTVWKLSVNRAIHADCLPEEEKNSNPPDLSSSHTVRILQKISSEDRNEIPSIHDENATSPYYAGEELSPAPPSELSCVTTEHEEKPIAASSSSFSSAVSLPQPALIPKNPDQTEETTVIDLDEEASLDATWSSIMRNSRREAAPVAKTAGRVPPPEGNDEINQRFDEFIKKNYDQIRLRKPGESIQPRRIR
ncbi:hypothetical protein KSP40_PGU021190 [Platanthera guangdongensis]|uniref:DUF4408 domain-containing protein n=1 Tax=Platanthera guangdongensis TaxID=2320717 RepID=A0ABR2M8K9_9ASPA